jgi:hypothetical protein
MAYWNRVVVEADGFEKAIERHIELTVLFDGGKDIEDLFGRRVSTNFVFIFASNDFLQDGLL